MTLTDLLKQWNGGVLSGAPKKLADKLGKSESAISRIMSGNMQMPEVLAPKMAKVLGVSLEQLMNCLPSKGESLPSNILEVPISYIPVVGYVSAENFNCVFEDDITPMEVLPVPMMTGAKAKALKVSGDCMEPAASDGDYVVVAQRAAYEDGTLIVAKVHGECTLKRMYSRGDKVLLVPDNKKYKRLEVKKEDLLVVGVVLFTMRKQAPKKL